MKFEKGFTIIELIVVIAIIAVLASIVLVNVTQYIAKSKDAAIKSDMSNLYTYGVTYVLDPSLGNGNFNNFCNDSKVNVFVDKIKELSNFSNYDLGSPCYCDTNNCINANTWCVYTYLQSETFLYSGEQKPSLFCIDSKGTKSKDWKCNQSTGLCYQFVN